MLALGHVQTIWGLVVIASHDVVHIVHTSGSQSDLEEICGPHSSVCVLGLVLRVIGRVNVVVDVSVPLIPLLVVVLLEMLMSRVDGKVLSDPSSQFQLLIDLLKQEIILLSDHTVTVSAVSGENLEA